MGDVADAIKDMQDSRDSAIVALDIREGVISSVANVAGGVTGVIAVVGLVQSLFQGQDNMGQVQRTVDLILTKLNTLLSLVGASDQLSRLRDLSTQLGAARAQLLPIQESTPGSPNFESVRGAMLDHTSTVLTTLEQLAFWQRPFLQEAVYHDDWAGDMPPPNQGGIVFDFTQIRRILKGLKLGRMSPRNSAVIAAYIDDMRSSIKEIARVLAPGGRAFYVIGENTIDGVYVKNAKIIKSLARSEGLKLRSETSRPLPPNRRYLPPPKSKNRKALHSRMRSEVLLHFGKPFARS